MTKFAEKLRERANHFAEQSKKEKNRFVGLRYRAVSQTLDEVAEAFDSLSEDEKK